MSNEVVSKQMNTWRMCSFVAAAAVVFSAGPPWSQANQLLSDLRHAAEQGDVVAQLALGVSYDEGRGVVKDEAEALRWFRLAAEQGDPTAQLKLGISYEEGRGVLKDEAEAVRWFRLAAEQGDLTAHLYLGVMYEEGRGVTKDQAEALRWFRLAAEQGDPTAQFQLGVMYTVGRGVLRRNLIVAHMWLNIAAANGSDTARKARDLVEKRINKKQIEQATAMARACMASDYADCSL